MISVLFSVIGIIIISSCSGDQSTVATVGGHKITLDQYKEAYLQVLKQPRAYDSPEIREKFLDELIDQYLLAEQARKKGVADQERFKLRLEAYRDKCLRDAHYKYVIQPQISLDSAEIKEIYAFTRQKRKIRHLFYPDSTTADSIYHLLNQGGDWNFQARQTFGDSALAESGGDLGWVYWDQMEYDLAMTVFRLPLHQISKPVHSTWGYHLLCMDNFEVDPLISQDDYLSHYAKTQQMVESKKGEKIAYDYITALMKDVKIQINPQRLQQVGEQLRLILTRAPKAFDQMNEQQLTTQELKRIEDNIWDYRNEVLATIDGQNLTMAGFAGLLNYIPYQAMQRSLKTTLDYAIRDFVLTEEARKMRLDQKDPQVKIKTDLFASYSLQSDYRSDLLRTVTVTDQDIDAYMQKNQVAISGNPPGQDLRAMIGQMILNQKKIALLNETLQYLRQSQSITKHVQVIHDYYNRLSLN